MLVECQVFRRVRWKIVALESDRICYQTSKRWSLTIRKSLITRTWWQIMTLWKQRTRPINNSSSSCSSSPPLTKRHRRTLDITLSSRLAAPTTRSLCTQVEKQVRHSMVNKRWLVYPSQDWLIAQVTPLTSRLRRAHSQDRGTTSLEASLGRARDLALEIRTEVAREERPILREAHSNHRDRRAIEALIAEVMCMMWYTETDWFMNIIIFLKFKK